MCHSAQLSRAGDSKVSIHFLIIDTLHFYLIKWLNNGYLKSDDQLFNWGFRQYFNIKWQY